MKNTAKQKSLLLAVAGVSAFAAVALGAYGAHMLKAEPELLRSFGTGSRYHFYHTLAMAVMAVAAKNKTAIVAAWLIFTGMILFSGGIYMAAIGQMPGFTKVTPAGGMSLMFGWLLFAFSMYQDYKNVDFLGD